MGTNCAPLLADLFLFAYESEFLTTLVRSKKLHIAKKFNMSFRYIDDLVSFNNDKINDYLSLIYPPELEIKETPRFLIWTCASRFRKMATSVQSCMTRGMILTFQLSIFSSYPATFHHAQIAVSTFPRFSGI